MVCNSVHRSLGFGFCLKTFLLMVEHVIGHIDHMIFFGGRGGEHIRHVDTDTQP